MHSSSRTISFEHPNTPATPSHVVPAGRGASEQRFALTLLVAMTFGLVWQAALVLILVLREARFSPSTASMALRDRLWLRAPVTATRRGGRLWWWIGAYALALAVADMFAG